MSERTEHGFRVGSIEATAAAEYKGTGVVELRAGEWDLWVQATPTGRHLYVSIYRAGKAFRHEVLGLAPKAEGKS
jgi:hypothetical protein